ncbi:hypothetical protein BO94DRAFT_582855 [Aspergillus sclerotioniger CBS 115572]|uniref:Uncharacterized protein n=1 Tax=Aspergillus sclerotioniger CBS 115572 TaxID=1450535 RepID=A0A317X4H1_9EURO|nr:hypothetical protein BO94DRAFT_582855 [Aspergillus sclerotioniger CBS 115572]PWY93473.1 hypothetical protein BO94DRAFT_582855 [Aspergillus sclerotioniger CBS 115572]
MDDASHKNHRFYRHRDKEESISTRCLHKQHPRRHVISATPPRSRQKAEFNLMVFTSYRAINMGTHGNYCVTDSSEDPDQRSAPFIYVSFNQESSLKYRQVLSICAA